jgi:hypothetical protein
MAINLCFLTSDKTNLNDTWKQSTYQVASTKFVMQGPKGFIMLIPTLMADLYTDWQIRWPLIWYYVLHACFGSKLFFKAPANWWCLDVKLLNRRSVILPIMSQSVLHSKAKMQVIDKWIRLVRLKGNNMTAIWIQSKKQYSKIKFSSNYCF